MFSTLKVSLSVATILEMASSDATTRWKPPAIKWILGLMVAAASTILSIPGCEQPTTSTIPSGVLMVAARLNEARARELADTRTEAQRWLGDPPRERSGRSGKAANSRDGPGAFARSPN